MMEELELLQHNASECRILAEIAITAEAREVLLGMAQDYEEGAATLQTTSMWSLDSSAGVGDWVLPKNGRTRSDALSGKA